MQLTMHYAGIEFEVAKGKKIKVGMQAKSGYRRKTDGAHSGGEMEIVYRLYEMILWVGLK
jgi:hypothetical protein